jgi:hypothetical protein
MDSFPAVTSATYEDDQASAESDSFVLEGDAFEALDSVADGSCKLIVTSPPYNIGKEYERDRRLSLREYVRWLDKIIGKLCQKVTADGHICWQSGNFVDNGEVFPLDTFFYRLFKRRGFKLRNRIIWHFNFGLHAQARFSGRYETLLWFTKSDDYTFNLDPVRVPQLYGATTVQVLAKARYRLQRLALFFPRMGMGSTSWTPFLSWFSNVFKGCQLVSISMAMRSRTQSYWRPRLMFWRPESRLAHFRITVRIR